MSMDFLKSSDLFHPPHHQYYMHTVVRNRKLSPRRHSHEFYELVLMVSGRSVHRLNGQEHQLMAGDAVLMRPGDWHCFSEECMVSELLSLQIEAGEMGRFLVAYGEEALGETRCFHLEPNEVHALEETYRSMAGLDGADCVRQYRILLGQVMQCLLSHQMRGGAPLWMRFAMEQMAILPNAAEGVSAFLRVANLSHAQLCRLMKKYYGMTPQQYIKNLRLNLAYEMIQSSAKDILTIAMEVGYSSFSHFQTAFKEKYGVSPSQLRRQSACTALLFEEERSAE